MKKVIAVFGALVCVFTLSGCSRTPVPAEAVKQLEDCFPDDMVNMTITHYLSGEMTAEDREGDDLDAILEWASGLQYAYFPVEENAAPGDCEGGEVYTFAPATGDGTEVSYIIHGTDTCYLLIDNAWYTVTNPSDPPIDF